MDNKHSADTFWNKFEKEIQEKSAKQSTTSKVDVNEETKKVQGKTAALKEKRQQNKPELDKIAKEEAQKAKQSSPQASASKEKLTKTLAEKFLESGVGQRLKAVSQDAWKAAGKNKAVITNKINNKISR